MSVPSMLQLHKSFLLHLGLEQKAAEMPLNKDINFRKRLTLFHCNMKKAITICKMPNMIH